MLEKSSPDSVSLDRCKTGISGLDAILCGGLSKNRLYLLQGEPGTGKTTLALQFLLEGVRLGEACLYITFSETREELLAVAQSHGFDISKIALLELSAIEKQLAPEAQNTVFHPSEVEMNETTQLLIDEVKRVQPMRVVFDSVSEMRMLAETPIKYRRQMLALKQFFSGWKCTVLLLDDLTATPADLQVQSIVHGVINLQKLHPEFGDERRRLNIVKFRGAQFYGGFHDYVLRRGGLRVFPRMVASDYEIKTEMGQISSDMPALDKLLGGGLDLGTSTLLLGPAGTGKSTLAIKYAYAAAERGDKAAIFAFEESLFTLMKRCTDVGMNLEKHLATGLLTIRKIDPAQLSPGEFADQIRRQVVSENLKVVVIDSLNGYLHAMPEEQFLILQLHELFSFLSAQGVATLLVLAQSGLMGSMMHTPIDLTYLADTVIITRYFESSGAVRKAVSVIKKRGGFHETTIREFQIAKGGLSVGGPLVDFQGVLTGVPEFTGKNKSKSEFVGDELIES